MNTTEDTLERRKYGQDVIQARLFEALKVSQDSISELRNWIINAPMHSSIAGGVDVAEFNEKLGAIQDVFYAVLEQSEADIIQQQIAANEEAVLPGDVVRHLASGEHPVRVWRTHRGLTQKELSNAKGIDQGNLSKLEQGQLSGTFDNMRAIAKALDVTLDDLVPWDDEGEE